MTESTHPSSDAKSSASADGEPEPAAELLDDQPGRGRAAPNRRRRLGLLAIATFGVAAALIQQEPGPSAVSHFALVKALSRGTAEIGPGVSIDSSFIGGKFYANKAPGLAFTVLPAYLALRAAGLQEPPTSLATYRGRLWQVTLFGALLPALGLLLLMRVAVDRVTPGYGAASAVLLGAGTLLLPFSTLLFGHMLSATLGFAAFVVLLLERQRGPSVWYAALAGLLAGLAVVVEYPLGIVVVVLAAYIASGTRLLPRLGAYAAGCLIGIIPLAAYNQWAFGSLRTLSYSNVITTPSGSGPPTLGSGNSTGFYGVNLPDLRVALSLLLSEKGLIVVAPLCIAALLGLPSLWRSGRRAETLVCVAVPSLFLAYNASYYIPFGGQGPGPRFLVPALPFLALPLGAALRRHLLPVLALGLLSVGVMAAATATNPLTGEEHSIGDWLGRLARGDVVSTPLWGNGLVALFPAALLLVASLGLALMSLPPGRASLRPSLLVVLVALAWGVTAVAAPRLLPADADHGTLPGTLAVLCLISAIAIAFALVGRRGAVMAAALVPLLLLLLPAVYTRQRVALLVTLTALGLAAVAATITAARATTLP